MRKEKIEIVRSLYIFLSRLPMLLVSLITSYFKDIIDDNFPGTPELSVTETLIILSSKFGISIKVAP